MEILLTKYQSGSLLEPLSIDCRVASSELTIDFQREIVEILEEIVRFL